MREARRGPRGSGREFWTPGAPGAPPGSRSGPRGQALMSGPIGASVPASVGARQQQPPPERPRMLPPADLFAISIARKSRAWPHKAQQERDLGCPEIVSTPLIARSICLLRFPGYLSPLLRRHDKGNPGASLARKATGPTRAAEPPNVTSRPTSGPSSEERRGALTGFASDRRTVGQRERSVPQLPSSQGPAPAGPWLAFAGRGEPRVLRSPSEDPMRHPLVTQASPVCARSGGRRLHASNGLRFEHGASTVRTLHFGGAASSPLRSLPQSAPIAEAPGTMKAPALRHRFGGDLLGSGRALLGNVARPRRRRDVRVAMGMARTGSTDKEPCAPGGMGTPLGIPHLGSKTSVLHGIARGSGA